MDTHLLTRLGTMLILMGCLLLSACQDTIPARDTIYGKSKDKTIVCPEGEELVTEGEGEDATQKCIAPPMTKPSNAIIFKQDFCACKDGKPVSFGNCAAFCSNKGTSGAERLYASFDVTADISLSGLGSVKGWCQTILDTDTSNPKCVIEARDSEQNTIITDVLSYPASNSIIADLGALSYDKTYVITLVEQASGARSKPAQIIKPSVDLNISVLGPLKNTPVSQYSCIIREFSVGDPSQDLYYERAYRMHFYYLPRMEPSTVQASNIFCHDIAEYGVVDRPDIPRLENRPGVFNLWDTTDPRFYDNNGNGVQDVNDVIVQKTKNFGGNVSSGTVFFNKFSWPGSPTINDDAGNSSSVTPTQPLGYYMAPWIDAQNQYRSFCLNSTNYNSDNPLFKAFRDIIGVDTEGLYIGEKAAEVFVDSNGEPTGTGFKDYILIREADLKKVWFYMNNGVPTAPTDSNVANVTVYFYYPLNPASPYIKSSSQRIYRVRGANELANQTTGGNAPSGSMTSYPPHDRKIGCIPKF